jgi:hypothetical protein
MHKLSLQMFFSVSLAFCTSQANAQLGNFLKDLKDLADKAIITNET